MSTSTLARPVAAPPVPNAPAPAPVFIEPSTAAAPLTDGELDALLILSAAQERTERVKSGTRTPGERQSRAWSRGGNVD